VNEKIRRNPGKSINDLVQERLEDHNKARGRTASSMIHAAVCEAVLQRRPEYIEEFSTPNVPVLE